MFHAVKGLFRLFGLKMLCNEIENTHLQITIDNTSAVPAINKMGSTKPAFVDQEVQLIWDFILRQNTRTHQPIIQEYLTTK